MADECAPVKTKSRSKAAMVEDGKLTWIYLITYEFTRAIERRPR